jgi:hypothetical protein
VCYHCQALRSVVEEWFLSPGRPRARARWRSRTITRRGYPAGPRRRMPVVVPPGRQHRSGGATAPTTMLPSGSEQGGRRRQPCPRAGRTEAPLGARRRSYKPGGGARRRTWDDEDYGQSRRARAANAQSGLADDAALVQQAFGRPSCNGGDGGLGGYDFRRVQPAPSTAGTAATAGLGHRRGRPSTARPRCSNVHGGPGSRRARLNLCPAAIRVVLPSLWARWTLIPELGPGPAPCPAPWRSPARWVPRARRPRGRRPVAASPSHPRRPSYVDLRRFPAGPALSIARRASPSSASWALAREPLRRSPSPRSGLGPTRRGTGADACTPQGGPTLAPSGAGHSRGAAATRGGPRLPRSESARPHENNRRSNRRPGPARGRGFPPLFVPGRGATLRLSADRHNSNARFPPSGLPPAPPKCALHVPCSTPVEPRLLFRPSASVPASLWASGSDAAGPSSSGRRAAARASDLTDIQQAVSAAADGGDGSVCPDGQPLRRLPRCSGKGLHGVVRGEGAERWMHRGRRHQRAPGAGRRARAAARPRGADLDEEGLAVLNCQGAVVVEECAFQGAVGLGAVAGSALSPRRPSGGPRRGRDGRAPALPRPGRRRLRLRSDHDLSRPRRAGPLRARGQRRGARRRLHRRRGRRRG